MNPFARPFQKSQLDLDPRKKDSGLFVPTLTIKLSEGLTADSISTSVGTIEVVSAREWRVSGLDPALVPGVATELDGDL